MVTIQEQWVYNNRINGPNPTNSNIFMGTKPSNPRAYIYFENQKETLLINQFLNNDHVAVKLMDNLWTTLAN